MCVAAAPRPSAWRRRRRSGRRRGVRRVLGREAATRGGGGASGGGPGAGGVGAGGTSSVVAGADDVDVDGAEQRRRGRGGAGRQTLCERQLKKRWRIVGCDGFSREGRTMV